MILGGPKDTITSLRTKGLKALVPPNSFGPPTMVGVVVDFKDREKQSGSELLVSQFLAQISAQNLSKIVNV